MLLLWLWTTTGLLFGLDLDLDLDLSILMLSSLFCVVSYFLIESKESTPLNPDLPILVRTGTLQTRTGTLLLFYCFVSFPQRDGLLLISGLQFIVPVCGRQCFLYSLFLFLRYCLHHLLPSKFLILRSTIHRSHCLHHLLPSQLLIIRSSSSTTIQHRSHLECRICPLLCFSSSLVFRPSYCLFLCGKFCLALARGQRIVICIPEQPFRLHLPQ
mmetsp:Transcript_28822/g.33114  ORF Transcript_28822/g.33114 Transcript_28822/m.33114 type:complete len:214 (-) Transcript_28822:268-909(-)